MVYAEVPVSLHCRVIASEYGPHFRDPLLNLSLSAHLRASKGNTPSKANESSSGGERMPDRDSIRAS